MPDAFGEQLLFRNDREPPLGGEQSDGEVALNDVDGGFCGERGSPGGRRPPRRRKIVLGEHRKESIHLSRGSGDDQQMPGGTELIQEPQRFGERGPALSEAHSRRRLSRERDRRVSGGVAGADRLTG